MLISGTVFRGVREKSWPRHWNTLHPKLLN